MSEIRKTGFVATRPICAPVFLAQNDQFIDGFVPNYMVCGYEVMMFRRLEAYTICFERTSV